MSPGGALNVNPSDLAAAGTVAQLAHLGDIFKPLEMYRSYFDSTPYHLLKNRSHSYYVNDGKRISARLSRDGRSGIGVHAAEGENRGYRIRCR